MLKRYSPLFAAGLLALGIPHAAVADDQLRSAQENLKSLGFYNGPADGELNADTKGAIRRYQLRNGLEATGQLDAETTTALSKGDQGGDQATVPAAPEAVPAPTPVIAAPPVPPSVSPAAPDTSLRAEPGARPVPPQGPSMDVHPVPPSGASDPAFQEIYTHTPYQNAPAEVQRDTLRKAQAMLAQRRLYAGAVNGRPGPDMDEALFRFQSAERLPRTGRMDIDTLARLHLLPVTRIPMHPGRLPVYRGRMPQDYGPNEGAVRGIPVD